MTQLPDGLEILGTNQEWLPEDRMTAFAREQIMRHGRLFTGPMPVTPDPAPEFHAVTLPALIAAGKIIDRGADFAANGFLCRHVLASALDETGYAKATYEAVHGDPSSPVVAEYHERCR